MYLAGEATHETLWGTVDGAWESGERAAEAALRRIGALQGASRAQAPARKRRRRTRSADRRSVDQLMPQAPKALISWSSGKDSAFALHEVRRAGEFDVVGALTTVTETFEPGLDPRRAAGNPAAQCEAAGLPQRIVPIPYPCPNEIYEARMGEAVAQAVARWHHPHDLRRSVPGRHPRLSRTEAGRHRHHAGVSVVGRPTPELAQAMIASGLEAYLATVDLKKLPAEFAGRKFDAQLLADLPAGVDPCGENGEFHTCVVAGPMFSRRLAVETGERVERDGYAYCDLDA